MKYLCIILNYSSYSNGLNCIFHKILNCIIKNELFLNENDEKYQGELTVFFHSETIQDSK